MSLADRLLFFVVNILAYLRYPNIAWHTHRHLHRWPDIAAPRTNSDYVQWRKVFDRNPALPRLVDKLGAKKWIAETVPELAVPETVWVGDRPENIPDAFLRPGFVLKTNHGSSQNIFMRADGPDRATINRRFHRWMKRAYTANGEWAYSRIERKIFVERLVAEPGRQLEDIFFRVHGGNCSLAYVALDNKRPGSRLGYLTPGGRHISATSAGYQPLDPDYPVPTMLPTARILAGRIGAEFELARVDFLALGEKLYFSEITFYPGSGWGVDDDLAFSGFAHTLAAREHNWFLRTRQSWPRSLYQRALRRHLDRMARLYPARPIGGNTGAAPAAARD